MFRLADVFEGWAIAENSTPGQSAMRLGWADRMRQLAEEVGPTWNPPEPELLSFLGFVARHLLHQPHMRVSCPPVQ